MKEHKLKLKKIIKNRIHLNPKKFFLKLQFSYFLMTFLGILLTFQFWNFMVTEEAVFTKLENENKELTRIYQSLGAYRRALTYTQDFLYNDNTAEDRIAKL